MGDASRVGPLLKQITAPIASVTADGACDGEPVRRAVAARPPARPAARGGGHPPRATTAIASPTADTAPSQRDGRIRMIRDTGGAWAGKRRRSAPPALARGRPPCPATRPSSVGAPPGPDPAAQETAARIACAVLNRVPRLGLPMSQRTA